MEGMRRTFQSETPDKQLSSVIALLFLILLSFVSWSGDTIYQPYLDCQFRYNETPILKGTKHHVISQYDPRQIKAEELASEYWMKYFEPYCEMTLDESSALIYSKRDRHELPMLDKGEGIAISYYDVSTQLYNPSGIIIRLDMILDSNYQIVSRSRLIEEKGMTDFCSVFSWKRALKIMDEYDPTIREVAKYADLDYDEKKGRYYYTIYTGRLLKRKHLIGKGSVIEIRYLEIDAITGGIIRKYSEIERRSSTIVPRDRMF